MPTVLRMCGFEVRVNTDDHEPPHVHVWKAGLWVKVAIGDVDTASYVLHAGSMKPRDAVRAVRIVENAWEMLLAHWRKIHG